MRSVTATWSAPVLRWRPTNGASKQSSTWRKDSSRLSIPTKGVECGNGRTLVQEETDGAVQVVCAVSQVDLQGPSRLSLRVAVPPARTRRENVGEDLSDAPRGGESRPPARRVHRDIRDGGERRLVSEHPGEPRSRDLAGESPVRRGTTVSSDGRGRRADEGVRTGASEDGSQARIDDGRLA